MASSKDIDITKTGPLGFRQLQRINNGEEEPDYSEYGEKTANLFKMSDALMQYPGMTYDPYATVEGERVRSSLAMTDKPWGTSRWDEQSANGNEFENIGDIRAQNQPWWAKVGAGVAKAGVLAGTTFAMTPAMLLGVASGQNIWDNDFTRTLKEINDWSEKALPNYYTRAEQERPWWENIGSANFIGDTVIKNIGFAVGALYSGGVVSGAMNAVRLPQLIGMITGSTKAAGMVTSLVGSLISSVNEGAVEAINNSTEWADAQKEKYEAQLYQEIMALDSIKGTPEYNVRLQELYDNYNKTLGKIADDTKRMGNADLLMNIPILMASNMIEFANFYSGGYKTARKATTIMGKADRNAIGRGAAAVAVQEPAEQQAAKGLLARLRGKGAKDAKAIQAAAGPYSTSRTWGRAVARGLENMMSEGTEEIMQRYAQEAAGLRYGYDLEDFYARKYDPDASKKTDDWIKALGEGFVKTFGDANAWEEFAVGAFMGLTGVPTFRSMRNAEGRLQSPITLQGGFRGAYQEYNEERRREENIVNAINNRIYNPETINYYQGIARHESFDDAMNDAITGGSMLDYKNSEFAQMVSDIMLFDNAGKIDDYLAMLDIAMGTDDANLEAIVRNTSRQIQDASGKTKWVGPFITENGTPMYSATSDGKQKMIDKLNNKKEQLKKVVDDYRNIKDDIDIRTGEILSDDQLEQLSYYRLAILDQNDRAAQMAGELRPELSTVAKYFSDINDKLAKEDTSKYTPKQQQEHDKLVKQYASMADTLNSLASAKDDKTLASLIASDTRLAGLVQSMLLMPYIYNTEGFSADGANVDKISDILGKMSDIITLSQLSSRFRQAYDAFIANPGLQRASMEQVLRDMETQQTNDRADSLMQKLGEAKSLTEFSNILDSEPQGATRDAVVNRLERDGNKRYKDYKDRKGYHNAVNQRIDSLNGYSDQVKEAAKALYADRVQDSVSLEDMANPNMVVLSPEQRNDALNQRAQTALIDALYQVNATERYRNSFSKGWYRTDTNDAPNEEVKDKGTTGADDTTTVPPVNSKPASTTAGKPVVGESTQEDVKKYNSGQTAQSGSNEKINGKRRFIPRAIPEFYTDRTTGQLRTDADFAAVMREQGEGNYDALYNFLKSHGAFSYVNAGNVKAGDPIGFMIDPQFPTTIFITHGEQRNIIGSLFEADNKLSQYAGLKELVARIKAEYNGKSDEERKMVFYSNVTGRVAQVFDGVVPVGNEEKAVGGLFVDINEGTPNASPDFRYGDSKAKPVFGIVGSDGTIRTNGAVDNEKIRGHKPMKAGTLVMLIPGASGNYTAMAVRAKHFNSQELNPADATVASTPYMKSLMNAIGNLVSDAMNGGGNFDAMVVALNMLLSLDTNGFRVRIDPVRNKDGSVRAIALSTTLKDGNGNDVKVLNTTTGREEIARGGNTVYVNFGTENEEYMAVLNDDGTMGHISQTGAAKDVDEIVTELVSRLMEYNLPVQVLSQNINIGGYNDRLLGSGLLTSNITEAAVRGSWFVLDWFDNEGNVMRSEPSQAPTSTSPKSPVNGNETVTGGTIVSLNGQNYSVDISSGTVIDSNGNVYNGKNRQIIIDRAWAESNGIEGRNRSGDFVVLPSGQVFNLATNGYLSADRARKVKSKLEKKDGVPVRSADEVIAQLNEIQKRVDKTRTDGTYYYVLEEDGQYHEYMRVHSALPANTEKEEQIRDSEAESRETARKALQDRSGDVNEFNKYLAYLDTIYGSNFAIEFKGKTDKESRERIVTEIRKKQAERKKTDTNATRSGTAVDTIVRQFFTRNQGDPLPERPSLMSDEAYNSLIDSLEKIKSNIESRGERFFANNLVIFHRYSDGTRVAGELDILAVDKDGNFKIYDIKTSRWSFYPTNVRGVTTDFFRQKANTDNFKQKRSTYEQYQLQLSAYKNIFESMTGMPVSSMAIIPIVLQTNKGQYTDQTTGEIFDEGGYVRKIEVQKGIPVPYNEKVTVPLDRELPQTRKASPVNSNVKNTAAENATVTNETADTSEGKNVKETKESKRQAHANKLFSKIRDSLTEATKSGDMMKIADAVVRFRTVLYGNDDIKSDNLTQMMIDDAEKLLASNGYEIVDKLGKQYHEGDKVIAEFVENKSLRPGERIYVGIRKAQVNKNGKMVQAAEVVVAQSPYDSTDSVKSLDPNLTVYNPMAEMLDPDSSPLTDKVRDRIERNIKNRKVEPGYFYVKGKLYKGYVADISLTGEGFTGFTVIMDGADSGPYLVYADGTTKYYKGNLSYEDTKTFFQDTDLTRLDTMSMQPVQGSVGEDIDDLISREDDTLVSQSPEQTTPQQTQKAGNAGRIMFNNLTLAEKGAIEGQKLDEQSFNSLPEETKRRLLACA